MGNPLRGSTRLFMALWLGTVWLSFVLLGGGLLFVVPRLDAKTLRVYADSRTLDDNRRFELALVAQGRDDLRWHLSGDVRYQREIGLDLSEADSALGSLQKGDSAATATASEAQLLNRIAQTYAAFRSLALSSSRDTPQTQVALDRLLSLVRQHRDLNAQQMDATLLSGRQLDASVNHWTWGLLLLVSALLLAGCLLLWARLFTPVLRLARAVQNFGQGDLKSRAPISRADEIGHLSVTFNSMADAIGERERDRLRFVATVAHDLKNPLTVIGGGAQLLANKDMGLTPAERTEWLALITKQTLSLEEMIGDLMDGVQAETGQISFDFYELEWAALCREIVEEYALTTGTHLIRQDISEPCWVRGDRKRLERVLMNLLSNAVKYSPAGREVDVSLHARGASAVLKVHDQGAGIASDDLPKLFLPFSRLDHTKTMASGTGLGLSSVKKIIEGHGGTIGIQSTLGVGTIVEITLPLLPPEEGESPLLAQ